MFYAPVGKMISGADSWTLINLLLVLQFFAKNGNCYWLSCNSRFLYQSLEITKQ